MVYTYNGIQVLTLGEFKGTGPGQDYQKIRANLKPGMPWRDTDFDEESPETLGKKASNKKIFWKRISEVYPNPAFVVDQDQLETKTSRFDIIQGKLSDCWLLVSIDVIAEQPALLKMVVPDDNSFDDDNSVFHFRFWKSGVWVDVVVDDRLPCLKTTDKATGKVITQVVFARNRENEFWVPLLEKAYAKLYGSYSMLQFGFIGDALVDLTSGVNASILLRSPVSKSPRTNLNFLAESYERGSMICLGIFIGTNDGVGEVGAGEIKMENGLAKGHAYSVTGLGQVTVNGKSETLVRVRNPWGTEFEWNGAWSDGSPEWEAYDQSRVGNLNLKKGDGEFWMTYRDVVKNFDLLSICNLPAELLKDASPEHVTPTLWHSHELPGVWSGAGSENPVELFKNPQYLLDLTKSTFKGDKQAVIISVFNKAVRLTGKDVLPQKYFPVLFTVRKGGNNAGKRFKASAMETGALAQTGSANPEDSRESFDKLELSKGIYVIIPVYGMVGGVKGEFLIRVFTEGESTFTMLN